MRILHVNDSQEQIGGIEIYVENIAQLQQDYGHIIDHLNSNPSKKKMKLIVWLSRIYNPVTLFRMYKKIKEFKPDIIHYHSLLYLISPAVMHAASWLRVPSVITIHDYSIICPNSYFIDDQGSPCKHGFSKKCLTMHCWPFKPGIKSKILKIYRIIKLWIHIRIIKSNTDAFFTPSINLADNLKKYLKISSIVTPLFTDFTPKFTSIKEENILLFVGRIAPEKGIDCLLDAMVYVKKEIPDIKLIIVGRGSYLEKYMHDVECLGLSTIVEFKGYIPRDKLPELYQKSKIVVIPSKYAENFGLVGLEAITFGRPIIVSDGFGLVERTNNGKVGKSFKLGDSEELASTIIMMLQDPDYLNQLSKNTQDVIKEYTKERHYNQIIKIYRDQVNKNTEQ